MQASKSLQERQNELRPLLATRDGRAELEGLAARYHAAGGRVRVEGTPLITYILVHERERGLIRDWPRSSCGRFSSAALPRPLPRARRLRQGSGRGLPASAAAGQD
jgi:hypothetical protein